METTVYFSVLASLGFRRLEFKRTLKLPMVPFYGLVITDGELSFELNEQTTAIHYDVNIKTIMVYIREMWIPETSIEYVQKFTEGFKRAGWNSDIKDYDSIIGFLTQEQQQLKSIRT